MDIRQSIRAFVSENFFVDDFGDEDSFLATGILDSLGLLQLVGFLEHAFGVRVREEELVPENLDSVARVAAFVSAKRGGAPVSAAAAA